MAKKDPFAGIPEGKLTLEQARQVINAHHEAERAIARENLLPLVGKYFKYWNNYGVGGKSRGWWLYAQVTGVDAVPMCTGWTFQRDENGSFEIQTESRSTITIRPEGSGWEEIGPSEFWMAAKQVRRLLDAQLTEPKKRRALVRRQRSSSKENTRG